MTRHDVVVVYQKSCSFSTSSFLSSSSFPKASLPTKRHHEVCCCCLKEKEEMRTSYHHYSTQPKTSSSTASIYLSWKITQFTISPLTTIFSRNPFLRGLSKHACIIKYVSWSVFHEINYPFPFLNNNSTHTFLLYICKYTYQTTRSC